MAVPISLLNIQGRVPLIKLKNNISTYQKRGSAKKLSNEQVREMRIKH
jgi:hypothetical protein